jgi:hypothetical protein
VLDTDEDAENPASAAAEVVKLAGSCVAVAAAVAILFATVESASPATPASVADVLAADAAIESVAEPADVLAADAAIVSVDVLAFDASVVTNEVSKSKSVTSSTSATFESAFVLSLLPVPTAAKEEVVSVASVNLVTVEVFAATSARVDVSVVVDAATAP